MNARATYALVLVLLSAPAAATLEVTVRRADGSPAANAVVCVGTSSDLVQFDRRTADAQGRVSFGGNPPTPFVVTASLDGRGVQQQRTGPPALGGAPPAFSLLSLTLPSAPGGPSCPATAAGPNRPLISGEAIANRPIVAVTPFEFVQLRKTEFCFGALGNACGQPQFLIPPTALCTAGFCFINGGSWDHDECCFANPQGMACRNGPLDSLTGHDGHCVTAWNKALRLVGKGLSWKRPVDFSRGNSTGRVDFQIYCAPRSTLLPPEDGRRCCSGRTRALTPAEAAASVATGESLVACE